MTDFAINSGADIFEFPELVRVCIFLPDNSRDTIFWVGLVGQANVEIEIVAEDEDAVTRS